MSPFVLAAKMDPVSQRHFNDLRQRHFPPERNYLDAHVTLFHALPTTESEKIRAEISVLANANRVIDGRTSGLRSLGRGVAFVIDCVELVAIRARLMRSWQSFLTAQDRQTWKPHITVQNKVSPPVAQALLHELQSNFQPQAIRFSGLDLWRYEGGPWSLEQAYSFHIAN